jgi:uncharacterized protein (DUF1800 family)
MVTNLPPLETVDPAEAWKPWKPSPSDPWGRKWVAHLYRRAGFGASRQDLLQAERLGPQGTLDLFLKGTPQAEEVVKSLTDIGQVAAARDDAGEELRDWWLYCMLQGGHPLREKLTLFWHNHFATSIAKVRDPMLMFRQNCLLRTHALGNFGSMLQAISKDGAMQVWLDSNSNVKGRPNENYARELMELFSLGVGNYSERDIREAARAFTGWHTDAEGFAFNASLHDTGTKTVLGKTGAWNGDDVVRIVLGQPAAARFLVRKLYHFFVNENATPPDSFLAPLADAFRKSDNDIAALMRTILSSRHFYSEYAFRARIKSPVEYIVGAVQAVYQRYPEGDENFQPLPQQALVRWLGAMGQQLFAPPNVKGWPGARAWLSTATVLERDNFASALALGTLWTGLSSSQARASFASNTQARGGRIPAQQTTDADMPQEALPPNAFDSARVLHEEGARRPEEVVRVLVDLYVPGGIHPQTRARLTAFVAQGNPTGAALKRRAREAVQAILTMAEYQLA